MILGPVFAAVVLIPLLIIFLIIFIRNRRDAREFAKFMEEKDRAKWEAVSEFTTRILPFFLQLVVILLMLLMYI